MYLKAVLNKFIFVVIPLTHHKNSGYTELKVLGVYLSPACGGGKITSTQFFLIDKDILQWCAKGIVIIIIAIQLFKFTKSGRKSSDLWILSEF